MPGAISTRQDYTGSTIEIPEELRSVFTATVRERDAEHVITVPEHELEHDAVTAGETYRIAVFEAPAAGSDGSQSAEDAGADRQQGPPVEEGEVREVTVESVGDQGDGIAKVERGYVVIVPDGEPGDQPSVKPTSRSPPSSTRDGAVPVGKPAPGTSRVQLAVEIPQPPS